jgi:hypothetical protein
MEASPHYKRDEVNEQFSMNNIYKNVCPEHRKQINRPPGIQYLRTIRPRGSNAAN